MTKSDSSETLPKQHRDCSMAFIHRPTSKRCARKDLPQLAQEVRDELIKVLSQTGGHLGPNLGVVELTIALHRVFDTPQDKFVFDVSHQGYVHKMFTGRLDRIRHDAAVRGAERLPPPHRERARLLRRRPRRHRACRPASAWPSGATFAAGTRTSSCVAGDAAFTCGISYEALNNVKAQTKRFIVVLNDNEWSIAKNVGAIASYLNNIVTNPTYAHLHEKAGRFIEGDRRQERAPPRAQGRGRREEPAPARA